MFTAMRERLRHAVLVFADLLAARPVELEPVRVRIRDTDQLPPRRLR